MSEKNSKFGGETIEQQTVQSDWQEEEVWQEEEEEGDERREEERSEEQEQNCLWDSVLAVE